MNGPDPAMDLPTQHAIVERVEFTRNTNGVTLVRLTSADAVAEVALYGAQVVSYRPKDQEHDVLWLGHYRPAVGKDCWGGSPLCWPWFMVRKEPPHGPFHGFGRLSQWQVLGAEAPDTDTTRLRLGLSDSDETRKIWPHAFAVELTVTLRRDLDLELITRNTGTEPMRLEHCFHTYFRVADVTRIRLLGLEDAPISVPGYFSRIVQGAMGPCWIEDPVWGRTIVMEKRGSRQTVLWNSGPVREVNGRQTGEPEWQTQVAVEALCGQEEALTVAPGGTAVLGMSVRVEHGVQSHAETDA